MTGTTAYILAKKLALGAVSGITNITMTGNQLIFHFKDGSSSSMNIPLPEDGKDGLSVINITIDINNHLICTMSDGSTIDAGELPSNEDSIIDQVSFANKEDIDELFKNLPDVDIINSTLASKSDIDKLF